MVQKEKIDGSQYGMRMSIKIMETKILQKNFSFRAFVES